MKPDLSNFMTINCAGLPYHGQVTGNELHTDAGSIRPYPVPGDGVVRIVRAPGAVAPTRNETQQAFDNAYGFEWTDHLIMSSANRIIGGQPLGNNSWLYFDANATPWVLQAVFEPLTDTVSVKINLVSLFGYFGSEYQPINRELLAFNETIAALNMPYELKHAMNNSESVESNDDGSKCLLNVYGDSPEEGFDYEFSSPRGMIFSGGLYEVEISGDGSLDVDTLGEGITASIVRLKDYDDLNWYTYESADWGDSVISNCLVGSGNATTCEDRPTEYGPYNAEYDCYEYIIHWNILNCFNLEEHGSEGASESKYSVMRSFYVDNNLQDIKCERFYSDIHTRDQSQIGTQWSRTTQTFTHYDLGGLKVCEMTDQVGAIFSDPGLSGTCVKVTLRENLYRIITPAGNFGFGWSSNDTQTSTAEGSYLDIVISSEETGSPPTGLKLVNAHTIEVCGDDWCAYVHIDGVKTESDEMQQVSYHPERAQWAIDAALPVAWA